MPNFGLEISGANFSHNVEDSGRCRPTIVVFKYNVHSLLTLKADSELISNKSGRRAFAHYVPVLQNAIPKKLFFKLFTCISALLLCRKLKSFVHKWKIGKMEKHVQKTRWEEDYAMIENEGLFEEYLEMGAYFIADCICNGLSQ